VPCRRKSPELLTSRAAVTLPKPSRWCSLRVVQAVLFPKPWHAGKPRADICGLVLWWAFVVIETLSLRPRDSVRTPERIPAGLEPDSSSCSAPRFPMWYLARSTCSSAVAVAAEAGLTFPTMTTDDSVRRTERRQISNGGLACGPFLRRADDDVPSGCCCFTEISLDGHAILDVIVLRVLAPPGSAMFDRPV